MKFNHNHYVPCLRWKQGEYQAVSKLFPKSQDFITPLIEIPEIGWDFEEGRETKSIDDHLTNFAEKKIYKKWGQKLCFVDLNLVALKRLANGMHPVEFTFNDFKKLKIEAVPVIGLERDVDYQNAVKKALTDTNRVCLRVKIEQLAKSTFKNTVDGLLLKLKIKISDCDLILDLNAPNFVPLDGLSKILNALISNLPYLNDWKTFSIIGTSFPKSMGGIKEGIEIIPRYEWQLYNEVLKLLPKGIRIPTFGDYGIAHPDVLEMDMRLIKPAATLRYTIDNAWCIVKGKNVRKHGCGQCKELCSQLMESGHYVDKKFSWGDEYIQDCAEGNASTGTLTTWRQVGTNHHVEKMIHDISNFFS